MPSRTRVDFLLRLKADSRAIRGESTGQLELGAESTRSGMCWHLNCDREVGSLGVLPPLSSIVKDTQTMRKLGARSLAVALAAMLLSGCGSTGGKKSFSWASMNPMTHFSKSDSDPVPKPSQMAPAVTLGDASEVASTDGTLAPQSPYSTTQAVAGSNPNATSPSPQRGVYNPNGYEGGLPLATPAAGADLYATQSSAGTGYTPPGTGYTPPGTGYTPPGTGYTPPGTGYTPPASDYQPSGYSMPKSNLGYDVSQSAQYQLGGGGYDIQSPTQGSSQGLPSYANPSAAYGSNAGSTSGVNTAPYQSPPLSSSGAGNVAQDPDRGVTPPSYSDAMPNSSSVPSATGVNSGDSYANSSFGNPQARDLGSVASLPQLPPLPSGYTNSQPAYQPGNTGYNPPNTPEYASPSPGGYVQPATATQPSYSPGSVSRYPSASSQPSPTAGANLGGYGTGGSVY